MKNAKLQFLTAMCVFGTIGLFRKYVPLSSSIVAANRALIGALILFFVIRLSRQNILGDAIRKNLIPLLLSGTALGFNWILLFESYRYTSIATATLCYYLAPILVILAAPLVLKEKISTRQGLCAAIALLGMAMVAGVFDGGTEIQVKGILFGLASAVLYACIVLINKRINGIPALTKTVIQLTVAFVSMVPYVLLTEDFSSISLNTATVILLLIMGVVHTGLAYWLYFSCVEKLEAHTVALFSYIDPVVAILISTVFLGERMTPLGAVGAVIILVSAYLCEKS